MSDENKVRLDRFPKSAALFERASRVIPAGIYGHSTPALTIPGEFPFYAERAEGCRYWDVDGREYLDFLCGYGPILLGHHHPEVEAAAERQRQLGDCFNHPTPVMVELAERLTSLVDFGAWTVFGKNGSDMTTWAMQVARQHTGRKKILRARQSYHGSHPWCTPGRGGLIEEDRVHIHEFIWNDLESIERLIKAHRNQIAALITTPFLHPTFFDSVMPAPGFLKQVEIICRREGIVLILDDVRAGFRLHLRGSHRYFGFEPDLICFSKALGNGHSISATVGREGLRVAASKVFLTGSFWYGAVAMAASLACLEVIERGEVIPHIERIGHQFTRGLETAAKAHGLEIRISGPPALPFMSFSNETNFLRRQRFCIEMVRRGVFLHPHHNWFISAAMTGSDVGQALKAADEAFAVVKTEFGS